MWLKHAVLKKEPHSAVSGYRPKKSPVSTLLLLILTNRSDKIIMYYTCEIIYSELVIMQNKPQKVLKPWVLPLRISTGNVTEI